MFPFLKKKKTKALFEAIEANDAKAVRDLLQRGADSDGTNDIGWTCLLEAASRGNEAVVELLLKHGSNPNEKCPAKLEAAQQNLAEELYRRGLQPGAVIREGSWSPLLEAASMGHHDIVTLLLAYGAHVNSACLGKVDPGDFVWDSQFRSMGSKAGVNPYRRDNWTPLMEASEQGHIAVVETFLNNGADVNAASLGGDTALMRAAMTGHTVIVEAILGLDLNLDILIVDDNSPDGTGEIADGISTEREAVHVLHREEKSGLGAAYMAGFKYALAHQYDLIFEMDADFSHDPKYIPQFLDKIESSDLVIGSRYTDGVNVVNWPIKRLLLSYYANMYSRIVTGMPIRDATGGYKCFRRAVLEAMDLDGVSSTGYAFQIEMNFRAWKKGFRIREIPIVFRERRKGVSKMSFKIAKEAIWMVWKLRVESLFGRI